jgi:integrase
MSRRRTGMIEAAGTWPDGSPRFKARLRLADGTKTPRFVVDRGLDDDQARAHVAGMQALEDAHGALLAEKHEKARKRAQADGIACDRETADAWHARFLTSRVGIVGSIDDSKGRWRKWVSPIIGSTPMADVTRDQIEQVRDALDDAIAAFRKEGRAKKRADRRLMPKAALNVWAVVTTAFKAACTAKRATGLRVREDNPCANVLPPEKGDSRRKTWIYPSEFLQLASCEAVPREWREVYAVACYLYLRPGELYELRWKDVDLDAEIVTVTRAWDWAAREVKAPKTSNGVRDVPIPPALLPLLTRMREGKPFDAKVTPIMETTGENKGAALLRVHLELAGVTHPRLTEDTATRMPVGFRSWRDSGVTWAAIDGVDVHKLQRRAGHDDIATTAAYVKEAEDRGKLRGRVFPALPNDLVWPSVRPRNEATAREKKASGVPEEGVENRGPRNVDASPQTYSRSEAIDAPEEARRDPDTAPIGPAIGPAPDLDGALARALDVAVARGDLDLVAHIVEELRARRLEAAGPAVVPIRGHSRP